MSFWSDVVSRFRGLFGGKRKLPPLPPPIKILAPKKNILNLVWGHVIYKPLKRPKFSIPRGMKTLEEFVEWGNQQDMEMKGSPRGGEHPLAIEVYCGLVLDHELTGKGQGFQLIKKALEDSIVELYPNFAGEILDWMEWGLEVSTIDEEKDLEAVKRFSRDGETFQEYDISNFVENKIRSLMR